MGPDDALAAWAEQLEAWRLPPEILAAAPTSPWSAPPELLARRADDLSGARRGASYREAVAALPEGGTVLDVGAGAGAASLPLVPRARRIVAVDTDARILEELARRARAAGAEATLVVGRWPDVAGAVAPADVAVCHHVLYNVPDLAPFVRALTARARRRVVVEITARHPLARLNPLWRRLHGVSRPERPTWEDAVRALRACGVAPSVEHGVRAPDASDLPYDDAVAIVARRLCLPREREPELERALRDLGVDARDPETWPLREREVVTLWWP